MLTGALIAELVEADFLLSALYKPAAWEDAPRSSINFPRQQNLLLTTS